jgi:hypothetical protein
MHGDWGVGKGGWTGMNGKRQLWGRQRLSSNRPGTRAMKFAGMAHLDEWKEFD